MLYFDLRPEQNAIQGDAPEGNDTFQWQLCEEIAVGGNWLMKWDELKKFPWYTHRLMHRKRVTSELHDCYFRLMTIKHSISRSSGRSNDYIIQLSSTSQWSCSRVPDSWRWDVVGKARPDRGALGNPDGVWGPEKMLIRCGKESQHPAEWA